MFRRYLSIIVAIIVVTVLMVFTISIKQKQQNDNKGIAEKLVNKAGIIIKNNECGEYGKFFSEKGIVPPVTVDLTQKHYKGIVLYYDNNKVYHPKAWESFEYLSDYIVDKSGNLYIVPMPFISISSNTFNFLQNLYRVDTNTGELSIFMHFNDIKPSSTNPFGLNAITYDCDDDTLWVSAIDESDYVTQRGVIYHINPKNKKILSKFEGWDALALTIFKMKKDKFLFLGSAKDNGFYMAKINKNNIGKPIKLFEIPNPQEHIQKIIIHENNEIEIKTIPFSYTLIAESSDKDGNYYKAIYKNTTNKWSLEKIE